MTKILLLTTALTAFALPALAVTAEGCETVSKGGYSNVADPSCTITSVGNVEFVQDEKDEGDDDGESETPKPEPTPEPQPEDGGTDGPGDDEGGDDAGEGEGEGEGDAEH